MPAKKSTPKKLAPKKSTPRIVSLPEDTKWKTQQALETLQRAAEIKQDKKLMKDVEKLASSMVNVVKGEK